MTFSFGFTGEEYSVEYAEAGDEETTLGRFSETLTLNDASVRPSTVNPSSAVVKCHVLHDLLDKLPLTLSYSSIIIDAETRLPRRELWDIKHQLMSEEEEEEDGMGETVGTVMAMMGADDVIRGLYEGGFKTWECSLDLLHFLAKQEQHEKATTTTTTSVLELGCGSALPSLYVFMLALKANRRLRLIVQDYNESVLQLSTLPNLVMAWMSTRCDDWAVEGDVQVTDNVKTEFLQDLERRGIEISCISGSWSAEMTQHTGQVDMILGSETIYETGSLPAFTSMIKNGLMMSNRARALIAAKSVYFGVGGGVEEFAAELRRQGLQHQHVFSTETGLRRTIMEVKRVPS